MTPLSAVFSAVFLALILLLVGPLTEYLPIPAMGGVILLVAYNLIDFHHIKSIVKTSKQETAIIVTTFAVTLIFDLEVAIYAGVLMSLFLYLRQTAYPEVVTLSPDHNAPGQLIAKEDAGCTAFKIIRIDGALFFGAVNHVMEFFQSVDKKSSYKCPSADCGLRHQFYRYHPVRKCWLMKSGEGGAFGVICIFAA